MVRKVLKIRVFEIPDFFLYTLFMRRQLIFSGFSDILYFNGVC